MQDTYDPDALYAEDSHLNQSFIQEAVKTLFRTLPLDEDEPKPAQDRRFDAALLALSAVQPRDEIEVMLGVQAISAYHAAAACFRIGMNHHKPHGDSTRHISVACTAARTFDTLLKAIERRQAKPKPSQPARRSRNTSTLVDRLAASVLAGETPTLPPDIKWTGEQIAKAQARIDQYEKDQENAGLDIANTEGILPGGGMILTEEPTPQQTAYMARRMALQLKREYQQNLRNGSTKLPKIKPSRPGDLIP